MKNLRKIKLFGLLSMLALFFSFAVVAEAQTKRAANNLLTYDGFGTAKVGMTLARASRVFSSALVRDAQYEEACYYATAKRGFKDISFMFTDGRLARIDVENKNYTTVEGARVGDTEARIKRLYKGRVVVTPHAYTDGHYLTVRQKGGKFAYVFETDGKRVTNFRAGKFPEVEYIEGCS
jgi:hypothetical protein